MTIATNDEGGIWACDVIYTFDTDFNLYWISSPHVRHSKAIEADAHVAGTITVSSKGEDNLGIQFAGLAQRLDTIEQSIVARYFSKRNKPQPAETDDYLQGRSWYILKPKFIDVINEKLYGFKKQKVTLE